MRISKLQKEHIKKKVREILLSEEKKKAFIVNPYPLNSDELSGFQNTFPFLREKEIEVQVDQTLIGGFILRFGSMSIDASVKESLRKLGLV